MQGSENTGDKSNNSNPSQYSNTNWFVPKCYYSVTRVNWICSPMRMRIYVVLVVDMALSQWEWNQRIKLRLSSATLHFTDRWAASTATGGKSHLPGLNMCFYLSLSHPGWVSHVVFYLPNCVCNAQCIRAWDGWIRGAVLAFLSFATVIGWLAVWTAGLRPGHLTWALTLITHCSGEEGGANKVKTSRSHNVQGTGWSAWPSHRCVFLCVCFFFLHI